MRTAWVSKLRRRPFFLFMPTLIARIKAEIQIE
jgi:hypothetical protein